MTETDPTEPLRSSLAAIFKENSTDFSRGMDQLENFLIGMIKDKLKEIRKGFVKGQATVFNDQCQKLKNFYSAATPKENKELSEKTKGILASFQLQSPTEFAKSLSPSFDFEGALNQLKEQLANKLNKYLDTFVSDKFLKMGTMDPKMELDLQNFLKKDIVSELTCGDLNDLFEKFQEFKTRTNPIIFNKMKFDFSTYSSKLLQIFDISHRLYSLFSLEMVFLLLG